MDKTCSIVQDLLPLYEEDMLREQTKEFVDGHLAQCAACLLYTSDAADE